MALYNQNYEAVLLNAGTTHVFNGYTATTIHQIFCLSAGTINVVALGGGNFVWSATTSDYIDVLVGRCTVDSGQFVGFKSQSLLGQNKPYYRY